MRLSILYTSPLFTSCPIVIQFIFKVNNLFSDNKTVTSSETNKNTFAILLLSTLINLILHQQYKIYTQHANPNTLITHQTRIKRTLYYFIFFNNLHIILYKFLSNYGINNILIEKNIHLLF